MKITYETMTTNQEIDAFLDYYGYEPFCYLCKNVDLQGLKTKNKYYCQKCIIMAMESIDNLLSNLILKDKITNLKEK